MSTSGFAVRCPYCDRWRDYAEHPRRLAITSRQEFVTILHGLDRNPGHYQHPKLLRCGHPPSDCPASFEAFVCQDEAQAMELVQIPTPWSVERDFRLYKTDHTHRWEPFCGILLSTQPVPRQKDLETQHILDPGLLSRSLLGASIELDAPVTVYSAQMRVWKGENRLFWVPIEAYAHGRPLVPPRYNAFCHICRGAVMHSLDLAFRRRVPHRGDSDSSDQDSTGEEPLLERDHAGRFTSTAFLRMRMRECPCYQSDTRIIDELKQAWLSGEEVKEGLVRKCWAGFTEVALPIKVHHHLGGVLMSGQFVVDGENPVGLDTLLKRHESLGPHTDDLTRFYEILTGTRQPDPRDFRESYTAQFRIDGHELRRRTKLLRSNAERIAKVLNARYREIRGRSEALFRRELVGRIECHRKDMSFFGAPLLEVLDRMRRFWAFTAAYALTWSRQSGALSVIAASLPENRSRSFGHPGKIVARDFQPERQDHPTPWMYDPDLFDSSEYASRPWIGQLMDVFEESRSDPELSFPNRGCCFSIAVPFADQWYAFVFAARDWGSVSHLPQRRYGGASSLCQEAILDTCTEVVYEFGEVFYRRVREDAWREFSALASHRIGNEVDSVQMLLEGLIEKLSSAPQSWGSWEEKLQAMRGSLRSTKRMLGEHARLVGAEELNIRRVNLGDLITRASMGVWPSDTGLTIDARQSPVVVLVDPEKLCQVFRELMVNAVRAGADKMNVTMEIGNDLPLGAPVCVGSRAEHVTIVFSNNGEDLAPERLAQIFEPFVRYRPGGSGVGLATARKIVEAHGGTIEALRVSSGAAFRIRLPIKGRER